jgi:hypothetical protein
MYNNPVSMHPQYRHIMVNVIPNVKLLDGGIVSDEELIEGAAFPLQSPYARHRPAFQMATPSHDAQPHTSAQRQVWLINQDLRAVRTRARKLSPVITIQRYFRGFLVRRALTVFHIAATIIQRAYRRYVTKRAEQRNFRAQHELRRQHATGLNCVYVAATSQLALDVFTELVRLACCM